MERLALFLNSILLTLSCISCNDTEKWQVVNEDVEPIHTERGVTFYKNEPLSGIVFRMYPNAADTLEIKRFKKGKPHGAWIQFYPGHQTKELRYFEIGRKEGRYLTWWENGKMKSEYFFEQDEYEGVCQDWSESGLLIRKKRYHQGHEFGLQQMWTNDGKLWANYEVRDGRNYGIMGIKGCATIWKGDSVAVH